MSWTGLSTQSMKDFGDKVANETRANNNQENIAKHVMIASIERAKISPVRLNDRGTEMVAGFTSKYRDYRKDF